MSAPTQPRTNDQAEPSTATATPPQAPPEVPGGLPPAAGGPGGFLRRVLPLILSASAGAATGWAAYAAGEPLHDAIVDGVQVASVTRDALRSMTAR